MKKPVEKSLASQLDSLNPLETGVVFGKEEVWEAIQNGLERRSRRISYIRLGIAATLCALVITALLVRWGAEAIIVPAYNDSTQLKTSGEQYSPTAEVQDKTRNYVGSSQSSPAIHPTIEKALIRNNFSDAITSRDTVAITAILGSSAIDSTMMSKGMQLRIADSSQIVGVKMDKSLNFEHLKVVHLNELEDLRNEDIRRPERLWDHVSFLKNVTYPRENSR